MGPLRVWRLGVNSSSSMNYYRATLQYDGTDFAGFQWQKDASTVQHVLNMALQQLLDGKISTMGASRTDSGVHAIEQIVKITTENTLDLQSFVNQINLKLPDSIRCLNISSTTGDFRPAGDTISKQYRYLFTNKSHYSSEERRYLANIAKPLNVAAMQACVEAIKGTHDFCNFVSTGSNVKTTIRTVNDCELTVINPQNFFSQATLFQVPDNLTSCYQFKIEANGFLKQMIRHLIRGLWMVGSGKISSDDFMQLLDGPKREKQLWRVAPSAGLYLYCINY